VSAEPSPNASELLWKKFPVLDDGFVCLVDVMGTDSSVAQAARVSYGEGTKKVNSDSGLIRYLMRHRHTTPFEMCELKFMVRVPMDTWRQWVRHRTASINEYSTRYSKAIDSQQATSAIGWRLQTQSNRQGSEGYIETAQGGTLTAQEKKFHEAARELYQYRLDCDVAREQARKDLPLSTYTEAYWKINLHNLLHFLALRMDKHAQEEIRDYAVTIGYEIVKPVFPEVWSAFEDYVLKAVSLTGPECEILADVLSSFSVGPEVVSAAVGKRLTNARESQEAISKVCRFISTLGEPI